MAPLTNRPCWQCGHCSTLVCPEPAADGVRMTGEPGHDCPVCRQHLLRAVMDDREPIEICDRCKGILMPVRVFAETLTARRRAAQTPSIIPSPADRAELHRRVECPSCTAGMIADWYYGPGNIVIDTCPACHVVWLDAGELKRVIDAPGRDRRL
jgi:Zn-finger nucleic acid-binding protein